MTGPVYVAGQKWADRDGELWLVTVVGTEPTVEYLDADGRRGIPAGIDWVERTWGPLTLADGGAS